MIDQHVGKIHQGDCVAGMAGLPDAAVNLVFADPPFNIGYQYDVYDDTLESDDYLGWTRQWMGQVRRILADDGSFWLAIGDEYAAETKILAQQLGFQCRSWVIWYYTFGVHCKLKFTRSHAHLFHFVVNPKKFKFNADDPNVRVPSARQLVYKDSRANSKGRMPDDTWILRPQDLPTGFTADEDVWYFPRVAGTFKERAGFHGCQMPEQLLARIIRACSDENDVVLDPFSGSATTVAVAKKLRRRYLSFEMSEQYAELGAGRLDQIQPGDPLVGAADPLRSVASTEQAQAKMTAAQKRDAKRMTATRARETPLLWNDPAAEIDDHLIDALVQTRAGFSLDRVLLDPVLNKALHRSVVSRGVDWSADEIAKRLLQLRTLGQLHRDDLTVDQPTTFDEAVLRRYAYAAELGWRAVVDRMPGASLDECLADSTLAALWDSVGAIHAPGVDPFQIRWTALKLRSWAEIARSVADRASFNGASWCAPIAITKCVDGSLDVRAKGWPDGRPRGLVRIGDGNGRVLLISGTDDARVRLRDQFGHVAGLDHWSTLAGGDPYVDFLEVPPEVRLMDALCVMLRQDPHAVANCLDLWLSDHAVVGSGASAGSLC